MRRRDSFGNDNRGFDDYTSLTQYDEMSTRQVGAGSFASAQAQPDQGSAQGGLYTQMPQQKNPYSQPAQQAQDGAPLYGQTDFLSGLGVRNVRQDDGSGNNDHRGGQNGFGAPALDGANAQIPFGAPPQYNYGAANDYGAPVQERPMVFSIERDPNGYIYEYSDRLEYYRYTGAGMVLINSVKKNR